MLNESLFELKLIDLPVIPFFPPDSFSEWSDYRFYGLRSASAYLLVYDVSVPSSFHFIKAIREQIYESRDMTNIPVIVVANKMDLVATSHSKNHHQNHFLLVCSLVWSDKNLSMSVRNNSEAPHLDILCTILDLLLKTVISLKICLNLSQLFTILLAFQNI